jgi:hypothetical protein
MRRSEKAMNGRAAIDAVIRDSRVCRIGMVDDGEPYVVPVCFGYDGEALYFHGAAEGRKVGILVRNPRVCFEFDVCLGVVAADEACKFGLQYRSVMGTGTVRRLEDAAEKRRGLGLIMAQYAPGAFTFSDDQVAKICVFRIAIEAVTGKHAE